MRKKTGRILAACLGALLLFVCWLIWSPVQGVPVLEYHMTGDDALPDELPYIVPQADLAAQLDYLQAAGYTTITMRDYLAARQGEYTLPAKPVILTFDDGYEDNYTVLLPELEQRGMCATVYVVTNDVGLDRALTWAQPQDMQLREEDDFIATIREQHYDTIIGDAALRRAVPADVDITFMDMPHFAVSGET